MKRNKTSQKDQNHNKSTNENYTKTKSDMEDILFAEPPVSLRLQTDHWQSKQKANNSKLQDRSNPESNKQNKIEYDYAEEQIKINNDNDKSDYEAKVEKNETEEISIMNNLETNSQEMKHKKRLANNHEESIENDNTDSIPFVSEYDFEVESSYKDKETKNETSENKLDCEILERKDFAGESLLSVQVLSGLQGVVRLLCDLEKGVGEVENTVRKARIQAIEVIKVVQEFSNTRSKGEQNIR